MTDEKDFPESLPPVVPPTPVKTVAKQSSAPEHLPVAATIPARFRENVLKGVRICTKCGREGRIVSNNNGVNVFCKCGYHWPISAAAVNPAAPLMPSRGFHKTTLVEPDWDNAYTDPGGMDNESFGPPPKPDK